jgi:ABC-type uncharacterized transport system substrate-binding protein
MSGWPSTRLLAILWLTLAILSTALSAPAQTPGKIPHIGYIWIGAEGSDRVTRPGLQKGLRELGYQEGRDIIIEYRNAGGSIERLRELVADTVASKVDIIEIHPIRCLVRLRPKSETPRQVPAP